MRRILFGLFFLFFSVPAWAFLEAPVIETFTQANGTLAGNFTDVANIQVVNNTFYTNKTEDNCQWWLANVLTSDCQVAIDMPDMGNFEESWSGYDLQVVDGAAGNGYSIAMEASYGAFNVSLNKITEWSSARVNSSNFTEYYTWETFTSGWSFGMQYYNATQKLILYVRAPGGPWTAIQNETVSWNITSGADIWWNSWPGTTTMRWDNLSYMNYTGPPAVTEELTRVIFMNDP